MAEAAGHNQGQRYLQPAAVILKVQCTHLFHYFRAKEIARSLCCVQTINDVNFITVNYVYFQAFLHEKIMLSSSMVTMFQSLSTYTAKKGR